MRHRKLRFILPVLAAALIAALVLWGNGRNREALAEDAITGNGIVEATETDISSKVAGRILSLKADEGDPVRKGQLLAVLDSGELAGQVDQAQGNLAAAQSALNELLAGTRPEDIRRARAQYAAAQRGLQQAQARLDLVREGARSETIRQLRAAYAQARARLSLVREGPRVEQIRQLRAAYDQAQARLSLVREGPRTEVLRQLQAGVSQAEAAATDAETELRRAQGLYAQGAVAAQMVDRARTQRDVARAQVEAARQRLAEGEAGARPQEIQEAEAAVEAARQRLSEAEAGARPQEIREAEMQAEIARQKLAEAEAGARPEEVREAEAMVAQARAQVDAARAALDLALSGPRPETIAAARARVAQARGGRRTAVSTESQTRIVSPVDGRVTLRSVELGELVTPGQPMLRLAELRSVWLRVYVPEPEVGRLKLGQPAEVSVDSYPNRRFAGRVVEIAQEPEFTPRNVQTKGERVKLVFGVKVEVDNPGQELKPGMPGDAVIFTGRPAASKRS